MLEFSSLNKTWLIDVDGTLLKHNGQLYGKDVLLQGVREFFDNLNPEDKIILLTARGIEYRDDLIKFLKEHNIRYDHLICDLPIGERILVNDQKPSGLKMAYAINKKRDEALDVRYKINEAL